MDSALLAVFPLVGGYIFASRWIVTKLIVDREDGHRLYFRAAFYGVFLFLAALLIRLNLSWRFETYRQFEEILVTVLRLTLTKSPNESQITALVTSLYALGLGSVLWIPFQHLPSTWKHKLFDRAIRNNEFESFIASAARRVVPICATMDNNKVYVGLLKETPDPKQEREFIVILPLMSGYREKDTGKITFTTFYDRVYRNLHNVSTTLTAADFIYLLPAERIQSINMFDVSIYEEFQKHNTKQRPNPTLRTRRGASKRKGAISRR